MPSDLEETKILINAILVASENALSLGQLEAQYKMMDNQYIPFKDFGFGSLLEFLQSCSDRVKIIYVGGTAQLLPVVDEESRHIRELVVNQKKDPSKRAPFKISQEVEDNILRLLAKAPNNQIPLGRLNSLYSRTYNAHLPAPKGKVVPWLSTSNRFAILTLSQNVKVIEPLSTVDLSRYKPKPFSQTPKAAQVHSMLSDLNKRFSKSTSTNQRPALLPTPGSAWTVSVPSGVLSQQNRVSSSNTTQQTFASTSATRVPQATAASSTTASSQMTRCAPTTSQSEPSAEVRKILVELMMKNPESTSVPALRKAYEYFHGPIDMDTFLNWLISMKECLVIGLDKGRVYLRPEYRPVPNLKITVRASDVGDEPKMNGQHRIVESAVDGVPTELQKTFVEAEPVEADQHQNVEDAHPGDFDRILDGICGLSVTDIIDFIEMLRSRPKVPLDQLLNEFNDTYFRSIEPNDGVEGLVERLSELGLLKVALNSDTSLCLPAQLRRFEYEPGEWLDVTEDNHFWEQYMENGILTEGISMTGKVLSYQEQGFTFAPNWCPPDNLYRKAVVEPQGTYIYCNGQQKMLATAVDSISHSGHWLLYLPDLKRFRHCKKEQLFVGPAQPMFHVMPIGRCPPVGETIKLKIVQVTPTMTFVCVDNEEPCCYLKSKTDANFNFRVLHWDNQRFIPREDLAKLCLDKGLTSMASSAIPHGEYFVAGSWMKDIHDPFFIPMTELIEMLDTSGFQEDAIHDLLLI